MTLDRKLRPRTSKALKVKLRNQLDSPGPVDLSRAVSALGSQFRAINHVTGGEKGDWRHKHLA